MKCKDCNCAHKGFLVHKPDAYICIGVPEPFEIEDMNNECTEYEYKRDANVCLSSTAPRLINANALKSVFREWLSAKSDYRTINQIIDGVPAIDAEPVRHGRWIAVPSSDVMTGKAYKCSECNKMRYGSFMPNYCQNCGAKMDGGATE